MRYFRGLLLPALCLALLAAGCATDNTEKDAALKRLRDAGIPFTSDAFVNTAEKGDVESLKLFIAGGMDPDVNDTETALIAAADSNRKESVEYLLSIKANPDDKSYLGTALCSAAKNGNTEITGMLLEKGADEEFEGPNGTPLFIAAQYGRPELVRQLVERKIDLDWRDPVTGMTPLMIAARNGDNEIVGILCDSGADIEVKDRKDRNAVNYASAGGHSETVSILLEKGAKIKKGRKKGASDALREACGRNDLETMRVLIEEGGADVNSVAFEDMPMLMWAVKNKYFKAAELLVKSGADVNAALKDGTTVLDYALETKNKDIIDLIRGKMGPAPAQDADAKPPAEKPPVPPPPPPPEKQ